jgi:predicted signal transduction protein with EAL and GGDEF domain
VSGKRRPQVLSVVAWLVIAIAAAIVAFDLPSAVGFATTRAGYGFWGLTVAALVVDVPLFGLSRRADLRPRTTMSVCFTFAIFVLWGAAPAVVVQAASGAVTVVGQRYRPNAALYLIARLVCATAVAQLIVDAFFRGPIAEGGLTGRDLGDFLVLAAVWLATSYGLLVLARVTVGSQGFSQAFATIRPDLFITAAAVLIVSPLLIAIQGIWKLLVAAPVVVLNQVFREQLRREQSLNREPVSGALNRQGLAGGMKSITEDDNFGRPGPRPFGIVLVDLKSLLGVTRMLGRDIYEELVTMATSRLGDAYGQDRVARLTGEAIAILLPDLTEEHAEAQAKAAVDLLTAPVQVERIPFSLDPVAGVALSPQHGRDLGPLLAKAELAVTEARRTAQPAMLYVRHATDLTARRIALVQELHTVLQEPERHGELTMLYQPQIDLHTQRLSGVEALVRWRHPEWGPVPTDELIEAVEPTDVMHLLTQHVLHAVASQMRQWNDDGQPLRVAVNISVQDLHHPAFVTELKTLISDQGIDSQQLTIEITERMMSTEQPRVSAVAATITQLGVGLSLDDFGTGHASLQQLRQLPLTEVKLDRSYVSGILDNPADQAVITSVHEMAQALGVSVVAEGVEDERTAAALARLPGTIGQGWHFGAPMPAHELQQRAGHGGTWKRQP